MTPALRAKVATRSGGRCEAEVWLGTMGGWQRCPSGATDIHHLLTKARGGRHLDAVGETYHLMHLCRLCHSQSDGAPAYEGGMLIDGSVTWDKMHNRPVYQGTDSYLMKTYGRTAG